MKISFQKQGLSVHKHCASSLRHQPGGVGVVPTDGRIVNLSDAEKAVPYEDSREKSEPETSSCCLIGGSRQSSGLLSVTSVLHHGNVMGDWAGISDRLEQGGG